MRCSLRKVSGFSLVEVTIALGVVAFALLAILALVPIGIKSNQISAEETRASCILSAMEADLRNSYASSAGQRTRLFGFLPPYLRKATGGCYFNPAVAPTTALSDGTTTGLDDGERPVPINAAARPRYQASIIYTKIPLAGSAETIEARLVVNWPATADPSPAAVTDGGKVSGYVETLISFPPP